jgi:hypothetical protein
MQKLSVEESKMFKARLGSLEKNSICGVQRGEGAVK